MPEGPEIRRVADRLGRVLIDQPLECVWFKFPHLQRQRDGLAEAGIADLRSWGKALLITFGDGRVLYSHNQLYGRWYVRRAGERPAISRDLRLAIETPRHAALLYSASEIALLDERSLGLHPFLSRLGPDVFATGTTPALLRRRLRSAPFAGRQLGALLLDQGYVAGLGNYLRSEILFEARLHPQRRGRDLSADEQGRLTRAIRSMAQRAYRTAGCTAPAARVRRLKAAGARRREYRHLVFGLDGRPCPVCTTDIRRIDSGGRRLYLCPRCQPEVTA